MKLVKRQKEEPEAFLFTGSLDQIDAYDEEIDTMDALIYSIQTIAWFDGEIEHKHLATLTTMLSESFMKIKGMIAVKQGEADKKAKA